MATITWKDGTKTNISDETEKNLREKFGEKETKRLIFKPVNVCHLRVDFYERCYPVEISRSDKDRAGSLCASRLGNDACILTPDEASILIEAIQAALAFGETYHG